MKKNLGSPMKANTLDKVCKLKTDNTDTKKYWIMIDGSYVFIHNQVNGEKSKARI